MRIFIITTLLAGALTKLAAQDFAREADSLYKAKNYAAAAPLYVQAAATAEFKGGLGSHYYNAACSYALSADRKLAFQMLRKAIANGYTNKEHLLKDSDLDSLHNEKAWQQLIKSIKETKSWSSDPLKAKLITTDIDHFWQAYDRAQMDTANRFAIYRKYYIDRGTVGLHDYFAGKVRTLDNFIKGHNRRAKFYEAIRKNTLTLTAQKAQMLASFQKFKFYYDDARFPNIYFLIGNFTSGGTASNNGLLIGADQFMKSEEIPTDELNLWERNNFGWVKNVPHLIAHELIHFNQQNLRQDTTLLSAVLAEGMADFLGELISGSTANDRLQIWTKGKEKEVWADFKKEMYLNRAKNWIANSTQETVDKPADLGYWVGYMICKAYYQNASDKKAAVKDILNIRDAASFYERSRVEALSELQ